MYGLGVRVTDRIQLAPDLQSILAEGFVANFFAARGAIVTHRFVPVWRCCSRGDLIRSPGSWKAAALRARRQCHGEAVSARGVIADVAAEIGRASCRERGYGSGAAVAER